MPGSCGMSKMTYKCGKVDGAADAPDLREFAQMRWWNSIEGFIVSPNFPT